MRAPDPLRAEVWARDDGICGLCGEPVDPLEWNLDHILPEALGGPTSVDNLRVTHPRCNRRRGQPGKMSDQDIDDSIGEWNDNEFARIALVDGQVQITGNPTPALLEVKERFEKLTETPAAGGEGIGVG